MPVLLDPGDWDESVEFAPRAQEGKF